VEKAQGSAVGVEAGRKRAASLAQLVRAGRQGGRGVTAGVEGVVPRQRGARVVVRQSQPAGNGPGCRRCVQQQESVRAGRFSNEGVMENDRIVVGRKSWCIPWKRAAARSA